MATSIPTWQSRQKLRSRGHHPVIATSDLYREKMLGGGFDFVPVRPHIPPPEEQDAATMEKVMNPKSAAATS